MSAKLHIGNLAYSVDDRELCAFAAFDVVSASVVKDKFSGKSRGFAFVELTDGAEAARAIEALDRQELGGRPIHVEGAKSDGPHTGGRRERDGR